ncbi:hypothetical protein M885DRAFT_626863 [Pelagophyceae sp. CCMP2097]|nr:hypothetical protein M885DRAFT_626863 [Pelagophyceae sp. CCMP2097]|mmetsp:Transcript_26443/g.88957  ORF Transcript_26443/g.88957 Transcript_26443/m.88957 type:complete len:252 (+) Transcript_26443:234-989(+)|eukprot:CAMPEP_0184104818 /NCGR_PEP_ID=MMETSP0974-20121125/14558_1 /TAXON_ID=483370 /ORGANISM="non described non described, Strain CCMP2097" /LENGTH=251 /DNA_ID=CAMNT_0026407817 /DNA_START=151 /DNA_END=906 /DNA_ORIENTATION=+
MVVIVFDATSATALKNRAVLLAMDPYVRLVAKPSGRKAETAAVSGGGTAPKWRSGGRAVLRLGDGDVAISVEVWNKNTWSSDDKVGAFLFDVSLLVDEPQALELPLDTGGFICVTARRAADADERALQRGLANSLAPQRSLFSSNSGQRLGGDGACADPEDRRAAAAAAAESRAGQWRQGGGTDKQKRASLADRRKRDDLVGKCQALYAQLRKDAPIGLSASTPDQLRKHLEHLRAQVGGVGKVGLASTAI